MLVHYFIDSETIKQNIDKFLTNLLIKPIIKNVLYCNVDEWIEKLSAILWRIPDNKWTKHKFELKSGLDKVAGQSLTIQSENVIDCLRSFIGYKRFYKN